MNENMQNLENLCIKALSENLPRYKLIDRKEWKFRFCDDIGDRLIRSCTKNLPEEELNESTYDFILNNFSVKRFVIDTALVENIEYFDILNDKSFEELKMDFRGKLQFRQFNKKFRVYTDKFTIINLNKENFCSRMFQECFNVTIRKELDVSHFNGKRKYEVEMEKFFIRLLKNTSSEIQHIKIPLVNSSLDFFKIYIGILSERRQLKEVYVNFDNNLPNLVKIFFDLIDYSLCKTFTREFLNRSINWQDFNDSLKSFRNIERMNFIFDNVTDPCGIAQVFSFLNSLDLKHLKEIHTMPFDFDACVEHFPNFLERCISLKKLELSCFYLDLLDSIQCFSVCSKTLKVINVYFCQIGDHENFEDLFQFLANSSIREIMLHRVTFYIESFSRMIESIEALKNSLTALTISECSILEETLDALPIALNKFKHLKSFKIEHSTLDNDVLQRILYSLQASKNYLTKIFISRDEEGEQFDEFTPLFELIYKCSHLSDVYINICLTEEHVIPFLAVLKSLQPILEKIYLNFCCQRRFKNQLTDFLRGCEVLNEVYGYASIAVYKKYLSNSP